MFAIYVRVSTDDQSDRGTIQAQIEFARKYCDLHEIPISKIYQDDGVTGTLPLQDRPAGSQLLQDAKNGLYDTLLVYKLDRLGRATRVILNAIHDLEAYGVKLKSMTEPFDTSDASGRFLLTILAGVADLERSNILERMWIGANRAAREGKWLGGIVPYGYVKNEQGMLEINDKPIPGLNMSEADVVRLIYKLITEEKWPTKKIADHLNALNVPPSYALHGTGKRQAATAGKWYFGRVLSMLRNSTYMGIHRYGKRTSKKNREIIERAVPAIVDEETWNNAQQTLTGNLLTATRNRKYNYLLRGLLRCGNCNYSYHGTNSKNVFFYLCNGRYTPSKLEERCTSKSLNMQWLDNAVWNDCIAYINNPGIVLDKIAEQEKEEKDYTSEKQAEIFSLEKQLATKDEEKERILGLFRRNLISTSDVEKQLDSIAREKATLQERINDLSAQLQQKEKTHEIQSNAKEVLAALKIILGTNEHSFELKRKILTSLIDKIVIYTSHEENEPKARISIHYKFDQATDGRSIAMQSTQVDNCTDKGSGWPPT